MFVEFRIIIYLKIGLDLNIVLKKNGNEAHIKSSKQMQKLVCMGKGVSQQNSFASASFFQAFRILNEGFQNSNLLKTLNKAPIVKTQAR